LLTKVALVANTVPCGTVNFPPESRETVWPLTDADAWTVRSPAAFRVTSPDVLETGLFTRMVVAEMLISPLPVTALRVVVPAALTVRGVPDQPLTVTGVVPEPVRLTLSMLSRDALRPSVEVSEVVLRL